MSYLIFARKYRPKTFEEMIGQKPVVQTLQNAIKSNRVTQAYLFSGMRGVGKTTAARVLAKALNCSSGPTPSPCNACEFCEEINDDRSIDVLEIDGASSGGIEHIRSLRETVKYKPIHCRYKVIIIDEVHQVTGPAFNALLKTLEEPPPNTIFIFATTEFHKVPATIVSRCQHFEFKKISHKEIIHHLMGIAKKENITITPYGLSLIAQAADGSLRDAQSLLDQALAFSGEVIQDEDLKEILGAISQQILFDFSSAILDEKPREIFPLVDNITESGYDLRYFYKELIGLFRNLLLVKSMENPQDILFITSEDLDRLREQAGKASAEDLLRYLIALQHGETGLRYSSHPRIYLEAALIKLCHFRKLVPLKALVDELEGIKNETGLAGTKKDGRPASAGSFPAEKLSEPSPAAQTPATDTAAKPAAAPASSGSKDTFASILEAIQKEKAASAAILAQSSSVKIKGGVLEIFFERGKRFYVETISRDIKLIERVASGILGEKVTVKLAEEMVEPNGARDKETETALKDPTVRYFMDTFKAQVLSVNPIKKPAERD